MDVNQLETFWQQALVELATVPLDAVLKPAEELSGREYTTHGVVMNSQGGRRIRAWFSVPNDPPVGGRFAAVLATPGYAGDKPIPVQLVMDGYAVLTLYPRGQGESRKEWELESGTKLTHGLASPQEYYYRGAYLDCIRGLDFLCSRLEIDPGRLAAWGRSQGGGFTLATAALDSRLRVAIAEEPFLSNYPVAVTLTSGPYMELVEYLASHPEQRETALETLSYFDTLNLVHSIECPTLVDIGMQDQTCPYRAVMPVFERIPSQKAVMVYPDLAHTPSTDFNTHAHSWLRRYLGG